MKKYINLILILVFLVLETYLLIDSKEVIDSFNKTLNICLYTLLPTMFASIIFTSMLIELEFEKYIPKKIINFLSRLFNISKKEVVIFILSIISGYPNNSRMLQSNKNLNNIINFTSFINPIFLICTIGSVYLNNIKVSIIIMICHYMSNIIIGILLRNKEINNYEENNDKDNKDYLKSYFNILENSISALCNIFSNILFFSILSSLISNIFNFNEVINSMILGTLEFSNGTYLISNLNIDVFYKGLLILIIITFGSFSIHMQMISVNEKIKYTRFLKYRILSVFISVILYYILRIFI